MLAKAAALSAVAVLVAVSAHAQPAPPAPPIAPAPPAPPEGWSGAHFTGLTWDGHDGWSDKDRAKLEATMKRSTKNWPVWTFACKPNKPRARVQVKAIMAHAEDHARFAAAQAARAEISPERIRAITERAMAQAQVGERAAEAAERAIAAIQPQLDALSRHLDHLDVEDAQAAK